MKTRKAILIANLAVVIFLGVGWLYFYWMIFTDDVTRMPRAMSANATILTLNVIFAASMIFLPITFRRRK